MIDDSLFKTIMDRATEITSHAEKRGSLNAAIGYIAMQSALMERQAAELCIASKSFIEVANCTVAGEMQLQLYNEMANTLELLISLTLQQIEINQADVVEHKPNR